MSLNLSSSMKSKPVNKKFFDDLDKAAAKHLVRLGVEKRLEGCLSSYEEQKEET